jgi:mannose-6-phosphate isomerase-like protein (cupin superfamily)
MKMKSKRIALSEALQKLPGPKQERFATMFEHGGIEVEIYAPRGSDPQKLHTRHEFYVVVQGQGTFFNGQTSEPFERGDFLFVPAGIEHRFENFSDDLVVWAFFYAS